ncbi:MAG: hypothetical protein NTW48_07135, partial [Chloroflexi bacterium]|nr:hypothetical protein [Chloroflexota bacterium]
MARTSKEVDALLGELEDAAARHHSALLAQCAVDDEVERRFDRVLSLYERLTARIGGLADQHDATVQRVNRLEKRVDTLSNPLFTLLIGVAAVAGWLFLSLWIKSTVGNNARVWMDGQEILWRDHPQFDALTGNIIGGGVAFIVGMTVVCLIIDLMSNSNPQPKRQNPPAVAVEEEQVQQPVRALPSPANAGQ